MAQTVKLKRSNTAGTIPTTSNLELGEVAINTKDGKFYLRKHVDGSSADQILAFAPQGVNAFGTQEFTVKVASKTSAHPYNGSGSSQGFTVNGLESPYLALIPGNTYKFDNSDSTNSGHPFRFYLDAAKTTAYTTGVTVNGSAGNSGAYVQIAVTTATPSQLYYQCSNHGFMGSASYVISGTTQLIADNSVTAAKIAVNAVGTSEIAQNSITSVQIPNNSITSTQISASYTSSLTVADNSITAAKIASNSILTRHIDDNQIGIDQLDVTDGTSGQVLKTDGSGTLSFVDQASGSVSEAFKTIVVSGQNNVVADSATDTLTFAAGSNVTLTTNDSTDTITIASSNTPGDDTVTTAKIVDLNVTSAKLAVNAVTTAKIADNAIDSTKIAQNSILTKHIDDNQVGIDQLNVSDGSNGQALTTDGAGNLSFSTISGGGGGGSQNLFQTIAVSGQTSVVADSTSDTLTLAGGSGVTITTNASTDTITIATAGEANQNAFSTVAVSGQSNVAADSSTDTLTFVAGSNMTITTDASGDSVTFASSGSGGGAAFTYANMSLNEFTGNGSTTAFTLGQTPGNEDNLIVFVDGVYQNKDAFSISGATLTFGTAPLASRKIIAYVTADAPTVALGSTTFTDKFTTSNNSTTAFTLSKTVPSEDNLMVFVDAAFQSHDDLSLSGTTLTLATAPPSGAVVTVHGFSGAAIGNTPAVSTHTGDGSTTGFTLSTNPLSENNTNVYIDGVYQHKDTYAVSGTTLTFSEAPPASSSIDVHILTVQSLAENSIVAGSLAAGSVTSSAIAANAVGSSQLAQSGVTAASYGSSSAIPVITVDADGRITAATTAATSSTLTIAADSGSNDTVTVGTDTLTFAGTSNEVETTVSNNQIQIGLPTNPTVGGNLTVTGNLIVNGSTTTVSTANMTVEDNLIELNTGATSNANDAGIVIERGSTGDNAIFAWDESADKFIVGTTTATGASTGNLTITAAPLVTGALTSSSATIASLAYPTSDGTNGQALVTDGSGTLSFGTVAIDGAVIDTYASTGNGSTTAFDTSIAIADEKNTWVFVDGVYQPKDTYSTSGTTVTFSAAPPSGADVEVLIGKVAGFDSADTVLGKYSTTTSGTGYSTGITFTNENNTFLFIDGIYQPKDTYSVSGSTLTLDADPVDGLDLELIATKTLNASAVETAMLANNAVSSAKIASNAVGTTEIATNAVGGAELAPAALSTQTMTGAKAFTGDLTVDTNTLHVDSANNRVGIGTASPASGLNLQGGDNTASKLTLTNTAPSPDNIWSLHPIYNGQDLLLQDDGTTVVRFEAGGGAVFNENSADVDFRVETNANTHGLFVDGGNDRVVIGGDGSTNRGNPKFLIELGSFNYLELQGATDSTANGLLFSDGASGNYGVVGYNHASDSMNFYTAGAEKMRIKSDGKVGLGTPSPAHQLDVRNSGGTDTEAFITVGNSDNSKFLGLYSGRANNAFPTIYADSTSTALRFAFADDTAFNGFSEKMRIDSSGDVSVGTSSAFGQTSNRTCFSINGTSSTSLNIGVGGSQKGYMYSDGTMTQLGSVGNIPLQFAPNDTYRAKIDTSGRMLIGITGTQNAGSFSGRGNDALQVRGAEGINARSTANGGGCFIALADSGNTAGSHFISVNTSGAVDFRVFNSNGDCKNTNGVFSSISSDRRTKENIADATSKLEDLCKLKVKNFTYKDYPKDGKQIGFMADEMESVFPGLVTEEDTRVYDDEGNVTKGYEDQKSVKVGGPVFAILTKAIQEQQAIIEDLKSRIETLGG